MHDSKVLEAVTSLIHFLAVNNALFPIVLVAAIIVGKITDKAKGEKEVNETGRKVKPGHWWHAGTMSWVENGKELGGD